MTDKNGYMALKRFVINELTYHLSSSLTYHGVHHTKDVIDVCKKYIKRLKIEENDAKLLLTGALIHDIGFLHTYRDHEEKGVEVAQELLFQYGYSQEEIQIISGLIRATKVPQQPQSLLEQILCDADLDYLGRADFEPISETLFQELQNMNFVHERLVWDNIQIKFLEGHFYHTDFAKKYRQPNKATRLAEIKERVIKGSY
jgi:uncharacterized protein